MIDQAGVLRRLDRRPQLRAGLGEVQLDCLATRLAHCFRGIADLSDICDARALFKGRARMSPWRSRAPPARLGVPVLTSIGPWPIVLLEVDLQSEAIAMKAALARTSAVVLPLLLLIVPGERPYADEVLLTFGDMQRLPSCPWHRPSAR
jgi:hypothetical protein